MNRSPCDRRRPMNSDMMNRSPAMVRGMAAALALALSGLAAPTALAKVKSAPSVAVLYFDYEGQDPQMVILKKGIARMLLSDLSGNDRYQLVERARLEDIIAELELNQTQKIDAATASRMGKLVGAGYVVVGGFFDMFGSIRIDARVIEVETGKIVQSVGAHDAAAAFLTVEQKVAAALDSVLSKKLKHRVNRPRPPKTTGRKPRRKPKPPQKLDVKTALAYSRALDAMDKKDKKTAKKEMKAVLEAQPDFELAQLDLAELVE